LYMLSKKIQPQRVGDSRALRVQKGVREAG
jgi:hypothetical protein